MESDKREDAAYRNGYMQAWREWSAGVRDDGTITEANLRKMQERTAEMEKRGREDA